MVRRRSFRGGVHPPQNKAASCGRPILEAPLPATVVIPLTQHIGAPNEPLVTVGDTVKVGQKIGDTKAFVAAPVHASVSGREVAVEPRPVAAGGSVLSVVIEREGDEEVPGFDRPKAAEEMTPADLRAAMREAGLVGMGGAGFPTHVKYAVPPGKRIEYVILNAAECEPYLTCDHRLLCEETELVVEGFLAMMRAAEAERGFIGIEENKPDAIEALRDEVERRKAPIEVAVLAAKYPQGEERMLVKAILGREVPSGGLPIDVGVVVNNVATAAAFGEYLRTGRPVVSRVITVSGLVAHPQNVRVRIGTLLGEVVDLCGGFVGRPRRLIYGGPMTGPAGYRLDVPVTKAFSGLVVQGREEVRISQPVACVRCGRCLEACPYGLVPGFLATHVELGEYEKAEAIGLMDCRECGSCSFVCPSRRPLTQTIKEGKAAVLARKKEEAAKNGPKEKEPVAAASGETKKK
ncbi:MAG: electron transport complex subunit RsxC [Firmicutes bacterium]|nr:electron transport complex subunit RsxC [Bacillota bacterium]